MNPLRGTAHCQRVVMFVQVEVLLFVSTPRVGLGSNVVFESKLETFLMSLAHYENVEQPLVYLICTVSHALDVVSDLAVPIFITEVLVATGPLKVRRFTDHHLTQSIDKEALPSIEQTEEGYRL